MDAMPAAPASASWLAHLRSRIRGRHLALLAITLLAAFLSFYRLEQEGWGNLYYAATVKSMLSSWHNFFFASFDPGGFVSVDKPPLGLWIQALSASLFGFNGLSLLLPQALAGVLAVPLLYYLVRRVFGVGAGLLAALVLAITPISVAAQRNNTMDSQVVLTSLLAAWAASLAAEKGKLRWLLACAVLVGIGFNIKMLQAFLVLPAFYLVYLAAPLAWWKRLLHLGLATLVLAGVSLAWVVIVDLTPPDQRPYVGSSQENSMLELVAGHNGLRRLLPGGPARPAADAPQQPPQPGADAGPAPQPANPGAGQPPVGPAPMQPPDNPGPAQPPIDRGPTYNGQAGAAGGTPFSQETGVPGLLRLYNEQLAGQASWLLPLAGIGLLAAAWQVRSAPLAVRRPLKARHQALLLWGGWLLPQLLFFSFANLFHRYYLAMLAPGIAALVGAGMAALWQERRTRMGLLLPVALLLTAFIETRILAPFEAWADWLSPLTLGLALLAGLGLLVAQLCQAAASQAADHLPKGLLLLGITALLLAPLTWSLTPLWFGGDTSLPYAGPGLQRQAAGPGQPGAPGLRLAVTGGGQAQPDRLASSLRLAEFLLAQRGSERFLAATLNANTAAPLILLTGEPVMALGGFSGGDRILSPAELAEMAAAGEVRFFLLPGEGQQGELIHWGAQHCASLPPALWGGPPPGAPNRPPGGPNADMQLYDCKP